MALGAIHYGLAGAVCELGAHSKGEKVLDDPLLCGDGDVCTGSAAAGGLDGEVKGSGAGLVFECRIGSGLEKAMHGGGASRTDGAVQRGGAVLILCINFRSGFQQTLNGF